jgi:hypothetical protein
MMACLLDTFQDHRGSGLGNNLVELIKISACSGLSKALCLLGLDYEQLNDVADKISPEGICEI